MTGIINICFFICRLNQTADDQDQAFRGCLQLRWLVSVLFQGTADKENKLLNKLAFLAYATVSFTQNQGIVLFVLYTMVLEWCLPYLLGQCTGNIYFSRKLHFLQMEQWAILMTVSKIAVPTDHLTLTLSSCLKESSMSHLCTHFSSSLFLVSGP